MEDKVERWIAGGGVWSLRQTNDRSYPSRLAGGSRPVIKVKRGAGQTTPLDETQIFTNTAELMEPLQMMHQSLISQGRPEIA